ncbi:MAG: protein TolR [Alphaproteobacteria bacterium]|nr:MAG: protein TolR [Alphaproteobacteria bacterium]
MGAKLAGRARGSRSRAVMAEINVTPFVDVMLVLLVIFMVTAPLLTAGVQLNLPKANARAIGNQDNKPLEISLDERGGIFIGDTKVTLEQMQTKLQAIAQGGTEDKTGANQQRVYIKADSKLDYGKVMVVMAAVNTAGFTKIALVTDPTMKRD